MFRKSALAMAMLGAVTSTHVLALGLGEIELKSALNQPFNAEVELLSATKPELGEVQISIASAQAFANAGIDRPPFLSKLNFKVARNAAGKPVILISSHDVVREPFLDFLLEMSWSKGRLLREYTVLVDPPVTMPAPAPVTRAPGQAAVRPLQAAPMRPVTRSGSAVGVSPREYGPTQRHDTLWGIAQSVRPDAGVTVEQTMLGLLNANPEAFVDNNINNLKAGYVLRVPDRETLLSIGRRDAARQARTQYAAWQASRGQTALASPAAAGGAEAPAKAAESHLQLLAPDAAEQAGGGEDLQAVQRDLTMANEALEEQRRKGEEMSTRLTVLEEQIANMQRLIQLKDNELARIQAQGGAAAASSQVGPAETAPADAVASPDTAPDGTAEAAPENGVEVAPATAEAAPETAPVDTIVTDNALPETAVEDETAMAADGQPASAESPEPAVADGVVEPVPPAEPVAVAPPPAPAPQGFIERLLANPLWLGAGAFVLALLAFFGLRRKRGVETEFQESILQAAQRNSDESDSEIVTSQPESSDSKAPESSLLSEFAVSDMGSIKNDGEADPLAEADVYLAYGRYKQAEELIKDGLEKDGEREDLNLKLLEVFLASKNEAAFDDHAQVMLAKLHSSDEPLWEKVAEMGRELNPENPMYRSGEVPGADPAGEASDMDADTVEASGLDFDLDLGLGVEADSLDAVEPDELDEQATDEPAAGAATTRSDTEAVDDHSLDFDMEGFDIDADELSADAAQGDGQLADLDEVSTKLDLARAYIDMGDPDGARNILDEVMEEGSDNQKDEARDIMGQMS